MRYFLCMKEINSKNSTNAKEFRRLRAVELFEAGYKPVQIAKMLGVTRGAVSQWLKICREQGKSALRHKKYCKNPCRLSNSQREELQTMLKNGAEYYGYSGNVWTQARVAELIMRKFGIKYHFNHIGKLLGKMGWSWQKPIRRALQRNAGEVRNWRENRWPAIKKSP